MKRRSGFKVLLVLEDLVKDPEGQTGGVWRVKGETDRKTERLEVNPPAPHCSRACLWQWTRTRPLRVRQGERETLWSLDLLTVCPLTHLLPRHLHWIWLRASLGSHTNIPRLSLS